MKTLEYTLRFTTPAFLGNAEQKGQWRTPPIKALLRQWWRVAYAANHGFAVRVEAMREEEGLLFGHAWLENDTFQRDGKMVTTAARKSEIRIRLSRWDDGVETKAKWGQQEPYAQKIKHDEVGKIGPLLYLGYGPLDVQKVVKPGQDKAEYLTVLKRNAAIQAGESATLSLAVPDAHAAQLEQALTLMNHYGTLGGRSRNGWGSFSLTPLNEKSSLGGKVPLRPLGDALRLDWPHAIGQDAKPLIWQTAPCADWKALMKTLAVIKIGLRTQFGFVLDAGQGDKQIKNKKGEEVGINHGQPQVRHWLSYPVTNHDVSDWKRNNARLPNSLRFKVRATPGGQLVGVIFHVPCAPPAAFNPNPNTLIAVWKRVHGYLDAPAQSLTRIPE